MDLLITDAVRERFPDLVLGILVARDLDNTRESPEIDALLAAAQASLPARIGGVAVTEHPAIVPWREAYRAFGAKPKDHPSSIENLVRRVLKGHALPRINPLVDLYNTVSLEHVVPVGGEDLDSLRGDVRLAFAGPDEPPVLLLGEPEPRAPKPGEVIYTDDLGAICRRWNWKEADRSKLTAATENAVLVIEGLPPVDRATVAAALTRLGELVERHCGGTLATALLDAGSPRLALR